MNITLDLQELMAMRLSWHHLSTYYRSWIIWENYVQRHAVSCFGISRYISD